MKPYIQAEVIQCVDDKKTILQALKKKVDKRLNVKYSWEGNGDNPRLRVEYETKAHFSKSYTRDKIVYETFINYLQKKEINIAELFPKKTKPNNEDRDLYLILKYQTNYKEPIRTNYYFTYKIIEFLGIDAYYEEVHDGFLLFYRTRNDFETAQMDLMDIDKIVAWLKDQGLWKGIFQEFFTKFF